MDRREILHAVNGRLIGALPGVQDVRINPAPPPRLDIRFLLDRHEHRFWLRRENGEWLLEQQRIDGKAQPKVYNGRHPRFEQMIAAVLGAKRPKVEVKDLRCPEDSRRLFGKLIVQRPIPGDQPTNILEFSCPQCKRTSGQVTMHYYLMDGSLLKTEVIEPWVKRESRPWFKGGDTLRNAGMGNLATAAEI